MLFAEVALKLVPMIVTVVPIGPDDGENEVIVCALTCLTKGIVIRIVSRMKNETSFFMEIGLKILFMADLYNDLLSQR